MNIRIILKWLIFIAVFSLFLLGGIVGLYVYGMTKEYEKDFSAEIGPTVSICNRELTANDEEYKKLYSMLKLNTDGWKSSIHYWNPIGHGGYHTNGISIEIYEDRIHILSKRIGNWVRLGNQKYILTKPCN